MYFVIHVRVSPPHPCAFHLGACSYSARVSSHSPCAMPHQQELCEGSWSQQNLDAGAALVIPVASPLGGALVVGESVVTYLSGSQSSRSAALKQTIVKVRGAWELGVQAKYDYLS